VDNLIKLTLSLKLSIKELGEKVLQIEFAFGVAPCGSKSNNMAPPMPVPYNARNPSQKA
jgi:hypothetical protein